MEEANKNIKENPDSKTKSEKVILNCPYCNTNWAELTFGFGHQVLAEDFRILVSDKKLAPGDPLNCSSCNYTYTEYDLELAILSSFASIHREQQNVPKSEQECQTSSKP